MSFLKSLFGGGRQTSDAPAATAEHKGFTISAAPYREEGQWQLAGVISKEIGGERKERRFVRADRFASQEEAARLAIEKGRQIIDEQGERLFG
jgi:hypothetical protein